MTEITSFAKARIVGNLLVTSSVILSFCDRMVWNNSVKNAIINLQINRRPNPFKPLV